MTTEDPRSSPMSERMRALLSRAAEEQFSEQRQVSAILADLRALVADVDDRLRALEARSAATPDAVAEIVLERAVQTLVPQVTAAVLREVAGVVRESQEATERRITEHVDEAVLALAEALLRRRRGSRAGDPPVPPTASAAPVADMPPTPATDALDLPPAQP